MQLAPTPPILSPARRKALQETLEHVRLTAERLTVTDRILTDRYMTLEPREDGEPDDLSVAAASIEHALSCLAVAFEEIERARFMP